LGRAGYPASTSRYEQHQLFDRWVRKNYERFYSLLDDGERCCGEWLIQAHGTRYQLGDREPFVSFDIIRGSGGDNYRIPYDVFVERCKAGGVDTVPLLHRGDPIDIPSALELLGPRGAYGAENVEGCVWRIERKGEFLQMAKYVRPGHEVGKYLDLHGNGEYHEPVYQANTVGLWTDVTICLWADVDTEAPPEERSIWIIGTGNPMPEQAELKFIDTVQTPPFVWHVYEEVVVV